METFLSDYEALTAEMQFEVAMSADAGKCIVAKEDLESGVELLEEVPLISWPIPTTAVGERPKAIHEAAFKWEGTEKAQDSGTDTFCDACLCCFDRESAHIVCDHANCRARFCSGSCAEGPLHRMLCGSFQPLRQWQAQAAIDSQFGAEAIARVNATVASRTLAYVTSYGLEPAEALLNALRPWERICAFPDDCELTLSGTSGADVAALLASCTSDSLAALLGTSMEGSDAAAIASELCSEAHVTGLMQRLLLNSFTWGHPTDRALRFGGVFMMMSNANHTCTPNMEIRTEWTRTVEAEEEEAEAQEEAQAEAPSSNGRGAGGSAGAGAGGSSSTCGEGGTCSSVDERQTRMRCTFTMRTKSAVAAGAPLSVAYIDIDQSREERWMQLLHWGFECGCTRCEKEEKEEEAAGSSREQVRHARKRRKAAGAEEGDVGGARAAAAAAAPPPPPPPPPPACHACTTPLEEGEQGSNHRGSSLHPLVTRDRPLSGAAVEVIRQRVRASAASRTGDWRYSVLPHVVPAATILQLSRDFFATTGLLVRDGNTFGPDFETMYQGHRNYFYFMNKNAVVPGSEGAGRLFEQLDGYTRQVVELHHPGVAVRLDRAFGAYYEGNRTDFHLGCSEHCDGDTRLVSTVVHAVLPDGDCGFAGGGELTVSAAGGLPAAAIPHSNDTVGTVVYMGGAVHHLATPIRLGGRRLVFCMFYACDAANDLGAHALN